MIKAEDLMIGDWVCINLNTYYNTYYKVKEIRFEYNEYRIFLDNSCVFATENEIMPIPITTEILEKNGFEDWDGWSIYSPENTGIEIAWLGTILKIGGECGNLELPAVMYVHQLQHALKPCGIEKEIEL